MLLLLPLWLSESASKMDEYRVHSPPPPSFPSSSALHYTFYFLLLYFLFFLNGLLLDRWQRSFDVPFKDALGGGYRIPSSHFLLFVKEKKKGRAQFGMFEICHLENQLPIWNNRNFFIVFAQRLVIKRHSPFIDVRYTQKRNVKHFLLATAK